MKKINIHLLKSFLILAYLSLPSLTLSAQGPTWILSKVSSSFSEPAPNVFQSQLNLTVTLDDVGNSRGSEIFFVIFNNLPSTAPTAQQIEQYTNGVLPIPVTMVVHDLIDAPKDSVAYSKKTISLPENKKYFTYMVSKGINGLYSTVKSSTIFLFKAKRSTNSYYYVEYLPAGYNTSQKYPIIIFLHGANELGNGTSTLNKVASTGLAARIESGKDLPFLVICPQTPINTWDVKALDRFIEELKTKYSIDLSRVYLTGLSLGGIGTWRYALRHPDKLAAIIPISGKAPDSENMACNISMLPIWAFHDDPDGTVTSSGTINLENKINACAVKITPRVTLFQNLNADGTAKPTHGAWNTAYSDNPSPASTATRIVVERPTPATDGITIFDWLLNYKRTALGPLVNVEDDKTIKELSTTITATASHPESSSSIVSYNWTLVNTTKTPSSPTTLPTPVLQGANTQALNVTNLATATQYTFMLTIKDNKGFIDTDEMTLTVNQPPVIDCGPDKYLTLPTNNITLNGSASDSDGTITSYTWGKIAGPAVTIGVTNTSSLSLNNMIAGSYTFRLTAKDNLGTSAYSDVAVIVSATNLLPIVNAGLDKSITLPTNSTTLTGIATDADGSIASYSWSKISGPAVTIANANTSVLSLSNMAEGVYKFNLTVTDNKSGAISDEATVTVNKAPVVRYEAETNFTNPEEGTNSTAFGTVGTQQGGPTNDQTVKIFDKGDKFKIYFTVPKTNSYKLNICLRSGGASEAAKTKYWSDIKGYIFRVNNTNEAVFTEDTSTVVYSSSYGGSHWGTMKSNESYSFSAGTIYYIEIESNQSWAGVDYLEVINVSGSSSRIANFSAESYNELNNEILYPNPASDKITLTLPGEMSEANITILNEMGKIYYSAKTKVVNGRAELSTLDMPSGMLILRINAPKYNNKAIKFMRQ